MKWKQLGQAATVTTFQSFRSQPTIFFLSFSRRYVKVVRASYEVALDENEVKQ